MENWLSKNVRSHIVYIKTLDWRDVEQLQITKDQYDIISEDIQSLKPTDFYSIEDADTWKVLFEWQRKDIIRFKEKELTSSKYVAICDLWVSHNMINWQIECDCLQKMWIDKYDIIPALKVLWFNINNPTQITQEMRKQLYIEVRKEWFKEKIRDKFEEIKKERIAYKKSIDPEYTTNIR